MGSLFLPGEAIPAPWAQAARLDLLPGPIPPRRRGQMNGRVAFAADDGKHALAVDPSAGSCQDERRAAGEDDGAEAPSLSISPAGRSMARSRSSFGDGAGLAFSAWVSRRERLGREAGGALWFFGLSGARRGLRGQCGCPRLRGSPLWDELAAVQHGLYDTRNGASGSGAPRKYWRQPVSRTPHSPASEVRGLRFASAAALRLVWRAAPGWTLPTSAWLAGVPGRAAAHARLYVIEAHPRPR